MRLLSILTLCIVINFASCAQNSIPNVLEKYNEHTVDYISVKELHETDTIVLLDAREREEYMVSNLKNSVWVGHKTFEVDNVKKTIPNPDTPIVVYCSIGVRSEEIGEKLKKAGFSNVKNLYGGIFAWKNNGFPVYDSQGEDTEKVHAYSKYWGSLLTNADKVYTDKTKTVDK
ncbi:MAG: rhodanese-like domain-containing protein [Flavobacteriaceae bacterium]